MEYILKRIDKLEKENLKKFEKINLLKEKIRVYELIISSITSTNLYMKSGILEIIEEINNSYSNNKYKKKESKKIFK